MLVWLLAACPSKTPAPVEPLLVPPVEPVAPPTLRFASIDVLEEHDRLVAPVASTTATIDGTEHSFGLHLVARSGDGGFGDVLDRSGDAIEMECHEQDFNSLISGHGRPFLVSHFECVPGSVYVTPMSQDATGMLTPSTPVAVDWNAEGGLWFPCSGQASAWGTHLGSEEYEPDARKWQLDGTLKPDKWGAWPAMLRYWSTDTEQASPYLYGWTTEVTVTDAEGGAVGAKHRAPGRFSHEISFVLPDHRTTYMSDDGGAVGLFLFIADVPKKLDAGTLYAAKLTQKGPDTLDVAWVPLGHATDAQIEPLIEAGVRFEDMLVAVEPGEGQTCPDGFVWTGHSYGAECLKLAEPSEKVPDPAMAASRLETRRYAAMMGATTELLKGEGLTWDAESERLFMAILAVGGRMLAEEDAPTDHIAMEPNACGVIAAGTTSSSVSDTAGQPIDSSQVVTGLGIELAGRPLEEPDERGNRCDVGGIANPDNITFLPGWGLLMIAEDTSRHRHGVLWAHDVRSRELTRVVVSPRYGEVTGVHWIPDIGGFGYLTLAVQHPWELPKDAEVPDFITDDDRRSFTAWLGPFPSLKR